MITMLPLTTPSDLVQMNRHETLIAVFCSLNTLIAYGSFAQAMKYWPTVQVSAGIALTPIAAFILTELCVAAGLWPAIITSANANSWSFVGMALVVGAAISVQFIAATLQQRSTTADKRANSAG